MTCDFTSFLTVFQSYQDDVRVIMKACVMEPRLRLQTIHLNPGPQESKHGPSSSANYIDYSLLFL